MLSEPSRSADRRALRAVELGQGLGYDGEIGARDRVVEPHQQVARFNPVAVLDAQLADHAAGRVLDLLDVRF